MARTERKREQIMAAAERLFTRRRFHEITLDDVARAARVGKGTIYLYFQDKDDLFFQVATSGFEDLCDLLKRRAGPSDHFQQRLRRACVEIWSFFERRRQLFRMMQSEEARMPWRHGPARAQWEAKRRLLRGAVAEILRQGVEEGRIRKDVPTEHLAVLLLGLTRAVAHARRENELPPGDESVVVDVFLNGAGVRAARRT